MGECSSTMVVKTDLCNYSGFKIYPGHGKKYVKLDQKMLTFINGKVEACQAMRRRNLTTKWTTHYRRINKKGALEEAEKKRRQRKATVRTREIAGLSHELHAQKKATRAVPTKGNKATDAALKELKSRKGAAKKK